jgi:cardiolipin synthase
VAEHRLPIRLLQGAQEYFPALIAAIDAARTTVYIESYLISDDPDTAAVLEALIRARSRGAAVYLLLDGFGAASQMKWVKERLEPHGIEIEAYRPGVRWLAPHTWRRLHRKLVLIDEHHGFVGGINLIGDAYDLVHGKLAQPRLDFEVNVTAMRTVALMSRVMRRLWWRVSLRNRLRGSLGRMLEPEARAQQMANVREEWRLARRHLRWRAQPARKDISHRSRLLLRDNLRHRRSIERWYLWHIRLASREILIANAYFVPTYRFREALMKAARRGVRVRLLIQGTSDQWWTAWATDALIGELVQAGIEVYQYTPSFLHAKVAVIDDAMTVGSSNIDPFSLTLSLEANFIAHDAHAAAELRERLELAIAESSQQLTPQPSHRGLLRSIVRSLSITAALAALRIFAAFSRTGFRVG